MSEIQMARKSPRVGLGLPLQRSGMALKDFQPLCTIHGRRTQVRAGFSLLEVALATFVLGFAITTSITVLRNALGALDSARNLTIATQIMQTEIEKMRLQDWAIVNAYGTGPTPI